MIEAIQKVIFHRISRNVAIWSAIILVMWNQLTFQNQDVGGGYQILPIMAFFIPMAILVYTNNLLLVPRYLMSGNYLLYGFLCGLLITLISFLYFYLDESVYATLPESLQSQYNKRESMVPYIMESCLYLISFTLARLSSEWLRNKRAMELLAHEKVRIELDSLKSQINPHFLFNSLNTIYGLARKNKRETTEAILQLSRILRYVIYEANADEISLKKEISFLEDFISFTQLRKRNKSTLHFDISGSPEGHTIAPLLFIPLIENGIKHGLDSRIENAWLSIKLLISEQVLTFQCSNNTKKPLTVNHNHNGIGLNNVKRRLELLYKNKHQINITDKDDLFRIEIKLELT